MKTRLSWVVVLVSGLILSVILSAPVSAQAPQPPGHREGGPRQADGGAPVYVGSAPPAHPGGSLSAGPERAPGGLPGPARLGRPGVQAVDTQSLGQPGTSYRYVTRFGHVDAPYIDDAAHLSEPVAVSTSGSGSDIRVWIADAYGRRALAYDTAGAFVTQIGQTGVRTDWPYAGLNVPLSRADDVAVDGSGHIWVVDRDASHVLEFEFDSTGKATVIGDLGRPWSNGAGNDQFSWPTGIAFDSVGRIYVSDSNNYRIQVFGSDKTYLSTIGVTGVRGSDNGHFDYAGHIFIDGDNTLYVADSANQRVQIFSLSGATGAPTVAYVATLGVSDEQGGDSDHFSYPEGVCTDASHIYVADLYNGRIQIFNRSTRAFQSTFRGVPGDGFGPRDVALDSSGNLYVADRYHYRVQQFDTSGNLQHTYGATGVPYLTDESHFNQPSGVAVLPDGSATYVVEELGQRLVKLGANGAPVWSVGEAGVCGYLCEPADVAVDQSGLVYVADPNVPGIVIFDSTGAYSNTIGGDWGDGDYEFESPRGVAIAPNGDIYVVDQDNQRVQIFDSNRQYEATLGVTGSSGSSDGQFNNPRDVAVDADGNIYVADQDNHRVQVFNSSRAWIRAIGVTGVSGNDFGHLSYPQEVAVDAQGRLFVADNWGNRVQVFDNTGAYLTTVGGGYSTRPGDTRQTDGLAVDASGTLYTADREAHVIDKFARGVDGWTQVNLNGFGNPNNGWVDTLATFGGKLYGGTAVWGGGQVWRWDPGGWVAASAPGFGDSQTIQIFMIEPFKSYLYAGVNNGATGAEIWRSGNGSTWARVMSAGFGTPSTNIMVGHFAVFNDSLYASADINDPAKSQGAQIWRSTDGLSWTNVVTTGFGDPHNLMVHSMEPLGGYLYAGTTNSTGGEVWRSLTGDPGSWTQVNTDGFGNPNNSNTGSFAFFGGLLYSGTANRTTGGELWRSPDGVSWSQAPVGDVWGGTDSNWIESLVPFGNALYAVTLNQVAGLGVFRSTDGTHWAQINPDGFGDSNNTRAGNGNMDVAVFNNVLYVGTRNNANGGEIWEYTGPTYMVAGRLTTTGDGNPIKGATVSAGGYFSTTTDAGGYYTFTNMITDTFTVSVTKACYTFSPESRPVSVPPDAVDVDFPGVRAADCLCGRVVDAEGIGMPGVIISVTAPVTTTGLSRAMLASGGTMTTTTDFGGYYILPEVGTGDFVVTPLSDSYAFEPPSHTVMIPQPPGAGDLDFEAQTGYEYLYLPVIMRNQSNIE